MEQAALERQWWADLAQRRCPQARERLLGQYRPWAERLAARIHFRLRHLGIAREDLKQSALVGLLESIERYQPMRGVPFDAFALSRVRGAVFDAVRSLVGGDSDALSPMHRSAERLKSIRSGGRDSADSTAELLEQVAEDILGLGIVALLEEASFDQGGGVIEYVERSQLQRQLLGAIDSLSERSRLLVKAHYFAHVSFKDLARQLDISKGRVSQLHHAALKELRRRLEA